MRKGIAFLVAIFSLFLFAQTAQAKVLPQAKGAAKKVVTSSGGGNIGVYPKLRGDRRALLVSFTNLQNAKAVSYFLTYKTNVQEEGAMGGLNLTGSTGQTSELLFGTCSKNVCRYHTDIRDARLEVSYTLKNGRKYLKKYKIKV
ncbi:MAG: hypothetical protein M1426_00755 [Patescibacteria group bacterium]|nr:hypothetical protein [Patescibacteria group bacterium]